MIDFMGFLIVQVWKLLSLPIPVDGFVLRIWYFPAFSIICAIVWKFIFGGGNGNEQ